MPVTDWPATLSVNISALSDYDSFISRGKKGPLWQICIEGLEEFPNYFIHRALTSTTEAIARTNTSSCLATSGTKPRAQSLLGEAIAPSTGTCSFDCYSETQNRGYTWKAC